MLLLRNIRGHRLWRGARRVQDLFPPTPLGIAVAGGAWLGLSAYGVREQDLVLLVLGYAGLGMPALALLLVVLSAIVVKLRLRRSRGHDELAIETGVEAVTGFTFPSFGFLPFIHLRWEWERPAARTLLTRRFGRIDERVLVEERGVIRGVRRRVVVEDVFGLARVALRADDAASIEALPRRGALAKLPLLTSLSRGDEIPHPMGIDDGDRVELRRYAPGDPARFIHWKVFGRTRRLMVRMPERALTRSRRTLAYQIAGPDDDATSAAARVAVESGSLGVEWTFAADGALAPTSKPGEALRQIVRSVEARDRGGHGLEAFVKEAERRGPASLVIFAPPAPGPYVDTLVRVAGSRRGRVRVVVAIDGEVVTAPKGWLERLVFRRAPEAGATSADLDVLARALAATRAELLVFDRKTGRRVVITPRASAPAAPAKRAA